MRRNNNSKETSLYNNYTNLHNGDFNQLALLVEEILSRIDDSVDGHILIAKDLLKSLELFYPMLSQKVTTETEKLRLEKISENFFRQSDLHTQINQEASTVLDLLRKFNLKHEWTGNKRKGIWCVSSLRRVGGEGEAHNLKFEAQVPICSLSLLSVLLESDLFMEWLPSLLSKKIGIKEVTEVERRRYHRVLRLVLGYWPLEDRELWLYCYGVDLLEEEDKILVVIQNSCPGEEFSKKMTKKCAPVEMEFSGGIVLVPVSETSTKLTMMFSIDQKMSFLPKAIKTMISEILLLEMFENIVEEAKSDKYQKRIQENPDTYQELQGILNEHKL